MLNEAESIEDDAYPERALEIIESYKDKGAKIDATFSKQHGLISKESCDAIVKFMDSHLADDVDSGRQMPVGLSDEMEPNTGEIVLC